jgi:spectinomycin phosphotransferase
MREPPRIAETTLRATLLEHYGIDAAALTFLPVGADADSSVYRVEVASGARYFLKLRAAGDFSAPSLAVPRELANAGVPCILAPLPTLEQALWVDVGAFALSLYPWLDARTGTSAGLAEEQWRTLGRTLRQIHASQLPPEVQGSISRESFIPSRRVVLDRLASIIAGQSFDDPAQRELAAFWQERQDEIRFVLERADTLGRQLRSAALPLALCHADIHTWNVLVDAEEQLWIVDWDEVMLAPKERDLMFMIGGIGRDLVSPNETAWFLEGYGDTAIHPDALVYYRYAWAAQDMGAYAEQVFFAPEASQQARRDAVEGFIVQFEPGNIVDIARGSE